MMRALLVEWLVAEGIVIYREFKKNKHAPMPGQLLATSGVFVLLAILAEGGPGAAKLAATLGAGFDIAAYLNLAPGLKANQKKAPLAQAAKTGVINVL